MPSPPSRIGFIVDHPTRDLAGGVLVARELAHRGFETALIPQYDQGVDVPLLGLCALVVNYARPVNLELVESFSRSGIDVFVLDTEGGVLADKGHSTPARLAAYIRDSGYRSTLSGYMFWGPILHEAFLSLGALPVERLHLTGCPRFDLYSAAWRDVAPPRREGHVLVNTNYPLVNPRFVRGVGDDRSAIRSVGYDDAYIDRLLADTRTVMDGVLATVRRLATDLPSRSIVVRPHPFERADTYRELLAGLDNVVVDEHGPVLDALRGAHAMLHLNCGTSIEAIMLGVPPLALEFVNAEGLRDHASLPSRASLDIGSYEELLDRLSREKPAPDFPFEERYEAVARPYFFENDGAAARRVAQVIAAQCGDKTPARPAVAMSLAASRRRPRIGQRIQSLMANALGSHVTSRLRAKIQPIRQGKEFSVQEVEGFLRLLATYKGEEPPSARRAEHPLTGLPLSSVWISPPRNTGAGR